MLSSAVSILFTQTLGRTFVDEEPVLKAAERNFLGANRIVYETRAHGVLAEILVLSEEERTARTSVPAFKLLLRAVRRGIYSRRRDAAHRGVFRRAAASSKADFS